MNYRVKEAGAADVAAPPRIVPEPVGPLRHVKQANIRSHRFAGLTHLNTDGLGLHTYTWDSISD